MMVENKVLMIDFYYKYVNMVVLWLKYGFNIVKFYTLILCGKCMKAVGLINVKILTSSHYGQYMNTVLLWLKYHGINIVKL